LTSPTSGCACRVQPIDQQNTQAGLRQYFETLQTGLSKLGDSSGSQTKAVSGLLQLINAIPMDGKQDYDVLGFIYEYLISMFAANAGKKAGEFYTPHEVSLLMSEIVAYHLRNRNEIKIYDPTSGSGSLLINIGRSIAKHINDKNNIKYYAQELKENTYNLTRMNLVMRGILPDNIVTRNGDTLEEDWPYFDDNDPVNTYNPLYVDAVVSNPPYSQSWDPSGKENDPRFASFGVAPKSKADYAFLLHDLFHLKPDGIMTIVLPHGVLFRGGEEERNPQKFDRAKPYRHHHRIAAEHLLWHRHPHHHHGIETETREHRHPVHRSLKILYERREEQQAQSFRYQENH
jgi:type I restriction enzyme M protein